MIDFDKVASLLHIGEKLQGHPHLHALRNHVDIELRNLNAEATKVDPPVKVLTKQEEEAAVKAKEAEEARLKQEAEARTAEKQTKALTPEDIAERQRRDAEQARLTQTEGIGPQPRVLDPDARTDLSTMNHPASERIENRNADTIVDRRLD